MPGCSKVNFVHGSIMTYEVHLVGMTLVDFFVQLVTTSRKGGELTVMADLLHMHLSVLGLVITACALRIHVGYLNFQLKTLEPHHSG